MIRRCGFSEARGRSGIAAWCATSSPWTLRQQLARAIQGKVWTIESENFAAVPTIDHQGNRILYGIVFSLDRVKKLPIDLDMRVRTAYPCDAAELVTYGNVRFAHLITLRMQGKRPNRNFNRHRPRPRLTWRKKTGPFRPIATSENPDVLGRTSYPFPGTSDPSGTDSAEAERDWLFARPSVQ